MKHIALVGTDSVRGSKGIYTLSLDSQTGHAELISSIPARDSGYMTLSPDHSYLYATVECMLYHGRPSAAVSAYRVQKDGSLEYINEQSVPGQLAAHVEMAPDGSRIFVSSYMSGNISVFPIQPEGSLGECSRILQDSAEGAQPPLVHCTRVTPDGAYLCAMQVGTGYIDLYELVPETYQKVFSFKTGLVRPRHVTFSADGRLLYVISENNSEIYVFRYQPDSEEKLVRIQTVKTVPEGFKGMTFCAAIRLSPDGKLLIATSRGPGDADAMVVYQIQTDGTLRMSQYLPTTGECPRDFNFTPDGAWILTGLQHSDRMAVYRVDSGAGALMLAEDTLPLPACSCVLFL